jgi:hypothetical protein
MGRIVLAARIEDNVTKGLKAGTSAKRISFSMIGKRHSTAKTKQTKRTSNLK